MDGSEGLRYLHKRSVDDIDSENNDEHWLWTHVNRIKRSIDSVIGTNNEPNNRVKRGLFDSWFDTPTEAPKQETTTAAPTTATPTTDRVAPLFSLGSLFGNEKSAEKSPEADESRQEQNDNSVPDELSNAVEDGSDDGVDDDDFEDGSGSSQIEPRTERFCKLFRIHFF